MKEYNNEIKEIRAAIKDLLESQKKTDEEIKKLTESQRITDEQGKYLCREKWSLCACTIWRDYGYFE